MLLKYIIIISALLAQACAGTHTESVDKRVMLGNEVFLDDHLQELEGKRVGLLMNPGSRVDGVHMLDTLLALGVDVRALFAAEHGFRGQAGAGERIEGGTDLDTGLPVYSLYGTVKSPEEYMLKDVDVIIADLPDMGVRFYTYSSTIGYMIEAADKYGKKVIVLDRPAHAGGNYISGWIKEDAYTSFVGRFPVPVVYGLTLGELMKMAVGEKWLQVADPDVLEIIPVSGWERSMKWDQLGIEWIPPSPNLPSHEHAYMYFGTAIFEGTNISEGRGTPDPFLNIGSPDLDFEEEELEYLEKRYSLDLKKVQFTPVSIPGKALSPKHEGQECTGIYIDPVSLSTNELDSFAFGIDLLIFVRDHSPEFRITSFANRLAGIDLKSAVEEGTEIPSWESDVDQFRNDRKPYLIYN